MQVNLEQQEFGCFTGEKPMSGFYAVLYALAACTHVDLYGFDPWTDAMAHDPSRQFRYHYFDDDQPRTGAHSFDATYYMYSPLPPSLAIRLASPVHDVATLRSTGGDGVMDGLNVCMSGGVMGCAQVQANLHGVGEDFGDSARGAAARAAGRGPRLRHGAAG